MSIGSKITVRISCVLYLTVSSILSVSGQARSTSADTELLLADEQTVTTATKNEQKISNSPSAVSVITAEQIQSFGATNLLDILRYVPGVDVSESNRSVGNVSIRGFNSKFSNKLLVMVDGRSIYYDFNGGVLWLFNSITLSQIKRIEIVRGPGSALYGANAFNGVINIITKSPSELSAADQKSSLRTFFGSQDSNFSEFQTSTGDPKNVSLSFNAAYNHSLGFGGKRPGNVHDSYYVPIVNVSVEKKLPHAALLFSAGASDATSDFVEDFNIQPGNFHRSFLSLSYQEDQVRNSIAAKFYMDSLALTEPVQWDLDTTTYNAEVQQTRTLSASNKLVVGSSFRRIQERSVLTDPGILHGQNLWGIFAQDEQRLGRQAELFMGLRADHHPLYGENITPRISLVDHLKARQTLRASFGMAFRAPTLFDSYAYYPYNFFDPNVLTTLQGNPNAKPERLTSWELGYRKDLRNGYFGTNIFYNSVSGLLSLTPTQVDANGVPTILTTLNSRGAHAAGLEIESELQLNPHTKLLVNYAYQDAVDSIHTRIDLTPIHKFNASLTSQLNKRWEMFLGMHYVGSSVYHNAGNQFNIKAYTRVDARLAYRLSKGKNPWTAAIVASNLFDERHYEFPVTTDPSTTPQVALQRRSLYFSLSGGF